MTPEQLRDEKGAALYAALNHDTTTIPWDDPRLPDNRKERYRIAAESFEDFLRGRVRFSVETKEAA